MKVFSKRSGHAVFLTRFQKRTMIWPGMSGCVVWKTDMNPTLVFGEVQAVGVLGHGLFEIDVEQFTYQSQDGRLTLWNGSAITGVVTASGSGPGTTTTTLANTVPAMISFNRA